MDSSDKTIIGIVGIVGAVICFWVFQYWFSVRTMVQNGYIESQPMGGGSNLWVKK